MVRFTTATNKTEGGSWLDCAHFLRKTQGGNLSTAIHVQHASFVRTRILYDIFVVEFCILFCHWQQHAATPLRASTSQRGAATTLPLLGFLVATSNMSMSRCRLYPASFRHCRIFSFSLHI